MRTDRGINSAESMIQTVRDHGILPFFKGAVTGWSVQDLTAPGCWFDDGEILGPWDWKIDCVRAGDIAYGKFIGGYAAFATEKWYAHLMNWRRSLPRYRVALGVETDAKTASDRQICSLAPVMLDAIKSHGSLGTKELRLICTEQLGVTLKKAQIDSAMNFLQMGTWSVVGDIERIYRGPEMKYSGWQHASNTTPELLFGTDAGSVREDEPSWARHIKNESSSVLEVHCSPEESRELIVSHIMKMFPDAGEKAVRKVI